MKTFEEQLDLFKGVTMGTRSLTHVKSGRQTLVTIYRQMDGYPTGLGEELREFLQGAKLVNGLPVNPAGKPAGKVFNGMPDLAAFLVEHLKDGQSGGVYIYPPNSRGCGEEYIYTVSDENGEIWLEVSVPSKHILFHGPVGMFKAKRIEELYSRFLEAGEPRDKA